MVRLSYSAVCASAATAAVVVAHMKEDQAKLPWCRKGGVMVAVDDLGEEGYGWPSAGGINAGSTFLLWGGKGHDKVQATRGSSMLADAWTATTKSAEASLIGEVTFADWKQVPLDPVASPDGRWKANGDVLPGYFVAFGGDDLVSFLNDLWVLPMARAVEAAHRSDDVYKNASAKSSGGGKAVGAGTATASIAVEGAVEASAVESSAGASDAPALVAWGQPALQEGALLPHERRGHTVTVLPASRLLVVVGGRQKHEACLQDAWVLPLPKGALTTPEGGTAGLGWEDSAWAEIPGVPGECRWGHAAAHATDPITKSEFVVIFGGRKYVGPPNQDDAVADLATSYDYNNELWLLAVDAPSNAVAASAQWTLAATGSGAVPVKRDHHTLSFDPAAGAVYLFGGRTTPDISSADAALNDLWTYSLATQTWTQLFPSGVLPESRYLHMAALASSQLVVFGGEHINKPGSAKADDKVNDLWAYSARANAWSLLSKTDCECTAATNLRLSAGILNDYMWSCLVVGVLFAGGMVWSNHRAGGGDKVFDYCRPRIRTPAERAAAAAKAEAAAPHVVVEMAGELAAKAAGAATRKKGYQRIT